VADDRPDLAELQRLLSLSTPRRRHDYRHMAELTEAHFGSGAKSMEARDERELDVLLAQYETLRQESMNSTNNRVQVLILGAAAMAALVGGALTIDKPSESKAVVYALFSIALPLMWIFVLLVWVSEAIRAHRVGAFLAGDVEARINARLGKLVLSWEAALWTGGLPRDERGGPSAVALLVLFLVVVGAPVYGILIAKGPWTPLWWVALQLVLPYGLLLGAILYVKSLMPRLENTGFVRSLWPGEK
jgi:hypothetical protein